MSVYQDEGWKQRLRSRRCDARPASDHRPASGNRKYRLTLTIANQYLAQMYEATAAAVFGNVGSLLAFQAGAQDAEILAQQLGGDLLPRDLLTLPRFRAYARLLVDGMPSRPFSMETIPPPPPADPTRAAIIRRTSRHRYTRPAAKIEQELRAAFL